MGGLQVITPKFLPKDARLVAQLSLPGVALEPVRAICRVAWVREKPFSSDCECGLEFVEMSPESRDLMAGCIERGSVR